jgi:hypothetical protein
MGPDSAMASSSMKIHSLPKLEDNGSNWNTYKERVLNTLTSRGLKRHVIGTAKRPTKIELRDDGEYYVKGQMAPLNEDEIELYETKLDEYAQKQAQVRDIIYETVSQSAFAQIKGERTAAELWKRLVTINEHKNADVYGATLNRLMWMQCSEDDDARKHITAMTNLKDSLAEMGNPLTDQMFSAYIRQSMPKSYSSLFTSIAAASSMTGRPYTSDMLIQQIYSAADTAEAMKANDARVESAMAAYREKDKRKGKKGRGPKKDKGPLCENCNLLNHMKPDCWRKGGGKEGQAPTWYVEKMKKNSASKAANAVESEDDEENVVLLSCINDDDENVVLAVTSDFKHEAEALAVAPATTPVIVDCGASRHFSPNQSKFSDFTKIAPEPIRAADGRTFSAPGKGNISIVFPMGKGQKPTNVLLTGVYYSPDMAYNLISVSRLDRTGHIFHIENQVCCISTPKPNSRIIGRVPLVHGLYRVTAPSSANPRLTANVVSKSITITELHHKMGHINHDNLRDMIKKSMVTGIDLDMDSTADMCTTCLGAKATRKPFPRKSTSDRAKKYGDKIVSDIWGPATVDSLGGKKYYNAYMDLATHEERVFFLKRKAEAFGVYKKYEAWVEVQRDARIKIFGTDRGGEFMSNEFMDYLERRGTVRHLTVHDSPQSNGKSEWSNRTHLDQARAMLFAAKLPRFLWAEAVRHSVWLRNRAPTRALQAQMTPHEAATGKKPDLSDLQAFSTPVWVKWLNAGKLDPRATRGRFVGYDEESKGVRVFWAEQRKVTVEQDVYFEQMASPEVVQIILYIPK